MNVFAKNLLPYFTALTLLVTSLSSQGTTHTFTTPTTIDCANTTYDGDSIVVDGTTLTVECAHNFAYLQITNNGVVTHPQGDVNGLQLTISGNLTIESGSSVDANGRGYSQSFGPGTPAFSSDGAGAGHGGLGGASGPGGIQASGGSHYGLIEDPEEPGSGGGSGNSGGGGAGGGLIRITVNETLTVNGEVRANGANGITPNYAGGGGSGGGIKLSCGTLAGNGFVRASGGNGGSWGGNGGGAGSGGRIAILYATTSFDGEAVACGGIGWQNARSYNGAAGSIYLQNTTLDETQVIADNCDIDGNYFVWYTTPAQPEATVFTARDGANVRVDGWSIHSRSVSVATNAKLEPVPLQQLFVDADTISVEATGAINADGFGYAMNTGPTQGVSGGDGGGAGHGGRGGKGGNGPPYYAGGATSGTMFDPIEFGSGGGGGNNNSGGAGGGAIRLLADDLLSVQGAITADGNNGFAPNYSGGGGAGGSIWITCDQFAGNGVVSAIGGAGGSWSGNTGGSGGAGGGRIEIEYQSQSYNGAITTCGGSGWTPSPDYRGGAGTVVLTDMSTNESDLLLSNCGTQGVLTEIDPQGFIFDSITIRDHAQLYSVGLLRGNDIYIASSADLVTEQLVSLELFANDNLTIEAGCTISATGKGWPASQGPGAGSTTNDAGGGGHGGAGGNGCGPSDGGPANGDSCEGESFGSGGGIGASGGGGAGGGFIKLNAEVINIAGDISADGINGGTPNWSSGGGAGGAIRIYAQTIQGSGFITARGGNGGSWGGCGSGGGGGGRVAFLSTVLSYPLGNINVSGGTGGAGGGQSGQTGTICLDEFIDCNDNGTSDVLEITLDPSLDECPQNGLIDECDGFVAPILTIIKSGDVVLLAWDCVYSATSYDIYCRLLGGPYSLLTNTVDTQLDVTTLIDPLNYDRREFYVVANGGN